MKKILSLIIALIMPLCAFGLVGCKDESVLVVGTNAAFPPFEYFAGDAEDGDIIGFDIDLIKEMATEMGYKSVKINHMPFESLISSVTSGACDIVVAGMTANDTRREVIDFSDSYFDAYQVAVVKSSNTDFDNCRNAAEVRSLLEGKKIGAGKGQVGSYYAEGSDEFGFDKINGVVVSNYDSLVLAASQLDNNAIDVVIGDNVVMKKISTDNPTKYKVIDIELTEEVYAMGIKKNNTALKDKINSAIKAVKANGKYETIYKKHFN